MSVVLENIKKSFGKNIVIDSFTYTFEEASRTAIVAPSGRGKTTLFRIISGLDKRYEGSCKISGKISYVFQEDRLFEDSTVFENLYSVNENGEEIIKLLDSVGLKDAADAYPQTLSGGMKRRVAIARALLFRADILLLDECFTGMDDDTKKTVADVINKYTENKTLIFITHDIEEAKLLKCKLLHI